MYVHAVCTVCKQVSCVIKGRKLTGRQAGRQADGQIPCFLHLQEGDRAEMQLLYNMELCKCVCNACIVLLDQLAFQNFLLSYVLCLLFSIFQTLSSIFFLINSIFHLSIFYLPSSIFHPLFSKFYIPSSIFCLLSSCPPSLSQHLVWKEIYGRTL